MARRTDTCSKRTPEILQDVLSGHQEAARNGPDHARRYLESALGHNKSMPNAVKFFVYDQLAGACAELDLDERRDEALALAWQYTTEAQEDTERAFRAYLPTAKLFDVGVRAALDLGDVEAAVLWCERAVGLGLGAAFERKAEGLRRRL
jgi:hypothetical protein